MSKSLTEMAAEILAARVRHEAMTSKQIESCLDDTFKALQKLKEKEDVIPENAVQPKKGTMAGTILNLIESNPKGIDTNYIMEQTGFKKNQVWATVNRAKEKGQVKTTKRGVYVSVKSRKGK